MTERLIDAARLLVPLLETKPWPSLGGHVCRWIEENLVHGPGDVRGQPAELTDEFRGFIWRAYEVYPRGSQMAGRRRFKRAAISRRKGAAKTELLDWVAICELDPTAPVRCGGWRKATIDDVSEGYRKGEWVPVGYGVVDAYIPLVATTEEQSDDLAYAGVKAILENCELGNAYDIGEERVTPRDAPGKLASMASAPNARDGARTTFQGFDETHLFVAERLKKAHATMLRNIPKRKAADAWSMEATTMYEPGEDSVAERTHAYALDIASGRVRDGSLYFDHRQAAFVHDLSRRRELIRAIEEASGDALEFADVAAIAGQYLEPGADRQAFKRYWLNQRVKGAHRWLAPELLDPLIRPRRRVKPGAAVVLSLDGSYSRDSTGLVGCTIEEKPRIWVEGAWEKPLSAPQGSWRTPRGEVIDKIHAAFDRYDVREFAPDPPGWHREIEELEDEYGEVVVRFETNQPSRMGPAADTFMQGLREEHFTLDGTEAMLRHLGNCIATERRGYTVPTKSSPDSPDKIDLAVGAVVAYSRAMHHLLHPPARPLTWRAV